MRAWVLVVAVIGAGCSGKITASGSRTVETIEVASGTVKLVSRFEAGISKDHHSGKFGLGSTSKGSPFGSHAVELAIATDQSEKTVYLCSQVWGGSDFPDVEGDALVKKLEEHARAAFETRTPMLEHCVRESEGSTLFIARCSVDGKRPDGGWRRIYITPGKEHGIATYLEAGRGAPDSCAGMLAKYAR